MGDVGEPGNALSAVRLANCLARPESAPCTCGAEAKGILELHAEDCPKGRAEKRWGEIFNRETGRS
jgi:hypothetical protein